MTVLIFIAVLVVLVVGHELGHFFAAKLAKMRVLEFGIGFPPKAVGKKVGDTEYTLNWIPFGGFVRIFGEDPKEASDPHAFPNKPVLSQAFVLFAGPLANFVLAFVLIAGALMVGTQAVIDEANAAHVKGEPKVLVGTVLPDSPAATAGIAAGDEVRAIAATPVTSAEEVGQSIAAAEGPVVLTLVRGGETREITVEAVAGLIPEEPERRAIGIGTALVGTVAYPVHEAVVRGAVQTYKSTLLIGAALFALIADALTLSADVSNIAGPVGIATLTGDAAAFGFGALLSFAAILSINLGIINLLPFPALDGGRLLFLAVETALRRKIPLSVAGMVNTAGFALLILLMLAVTVNDISRLVG